MALPSFLPSFLPLCLSHLEIYELYGATDERRPPTLNIHASSAPDTPRRRCSATPLGASIYDVHKIVPPPPSLSANLGSFLTSPSLRTSYVEAPFPLSAASIHRPPVASVRRVALVCPSRSVQKIGGAECVYPRGTFKERTMTTTGKTIGHRTRASMGRPINW